MSERDRYAHYHPEERPFVDKVQDWLDRVAERHEIRRTDFLDPRQAFILESLAKREGEVALRLDGGCETAERRRAILTPPYRDPELESAGLSVLEVVPAVSGDTLDLDHGDYLGALLGLGIKRDKIGDIHVHASFAHIVVAEEMADYLDVNLRQVHRASVHTRQLEIASLAPAVEKLEEQHFTVASLRLDALAGDVYRLSRAKILAPIAAGRCKVNWKQEENPSRQLQQGDVVSLKGFGRFKVLESEGVTKKGRIRVLIGKYV